MMYCIYLRKSRRDIEAEQRGEYDVAPSNEAKNALLRAVLDKVIYQKNACLQARRKSL